MPHSSNTPERCVLIGNVQGMKTTIELLHMTMMLLKD